MRALCLVAALLLAQPFWETKPPAQWTDDELEAFFRDSPWAQVLHSAVGDAQVFLASPAVVRKAEAERMRREKSELPPDDDYAEYLRENAGRHIVLAVHVDRLEAYEDRGEVKRLEKSSVLKIGKRKYQIVGFFPPTPANPYVRLLWDKSVLDSGDTVLKFDLYVPGLTGPDRMVEFRRPPDL